MRSMCTAAFATLLQLLVVAGETDCGLTIQQHASPAALSRIIPASEGNANFAVAWQDGQTISFQRFHADCSPRSPSVVMANTDDFWRQPGDSGLSDVAGLPGDAGSVVAWTLEGDIWFRAVYGNNSLAQDAVRANNASAFDRAAVRVVAHPLAPGKFLLLWMSWGQDGDGWGIFARAFNLDGQPDGEEFQVNALWRHFQWQAKVAVCDDGSIWAAWTNSTGDQDTETGPFLRYLGRGVPGGWEFAPGVEKKVGDHTPLTSTLVCAGVGSSASAGLGASMWGGAERSLTPGSASLLWLESNGRELDLQLHKEEPPSPVSSSAAVAQLRRLSATLPVLERFFRFLERWQAFARALGSSLSFGILAGLASSPWARRPEHQLAPEAWEQHIAQSHTRAALQNSSQQQQSQQQQQQFSSFWSQQGGVGRGHVFMTAWNGLLAILTCTDRGAVQVQLVDFHEGHQPFAYAPRLLSSTAVVAHMVWEPPTPDEGENARVVICWADGGSIDSEQPPHFACARHRASYLKVGHIEDLGGKLALVIVSCLMLAFLCLRRCTTDFGRGARAAGALGRRTPQQVQATARRVRQALSQARTRELREQLAAIPSAPQDDTDFINTVPEGTAGDSEQQLTEQAVAGRPGGMARAAALAAAARAAAARAAAAAGPPAPEGCAVALCPICQCDVTVRVALQRCGHTACRECVTRLVDLGQPCHICRGEIEGVQAVYI